MSAAALAMVVTAAFVHAGWNLAAKRVPGGGAPFVWLYYTVSAVACLPAAAVELAAGGARPGWGWLLAMAVTAASHVAYGLVLQRGYRVGDLSVVYPLARGTGPLLSVLAAVVLLGERPGWLGGLGAALVITGVLIIAAGPAASAAGPAERRARRIGIGYGLLTGVVIACYTLWDAHSVTSLAVPPVVYFAGGAVLQSALLAPAALRRGSAVGEVWRRHRAEVLAVGLLSPVAYLLVLFALRMAPVSLVAPARELSIVLGGLAGWLLLGEPNPGRRLLGALVVLGGITALGLA